MKVAQMLFFIVFSQFVFSQEFLADVQVDYSQVQTGNTQVYGTLESSLKNFINKTKWTDKNYKSFEKIRCSFAIIINSRPSNDTFEASLIVQSMRPVYNSTYFSPALNINDTKFTFKYVQFEPLVFNERKFSGKNLTDVIAFYLYTILGFDADSYAPNGGQIYFAKAKAIADNAQNQSFPGWNFLDGYRSRGSFITDLLKPQNSEFRLVNYNYHRLGLDMLTTNELNAKNQIIKSINLLGKLRNTFQFYALDVFMTTKKQEIVDIFSGGNPATGNIAEMKNTLNQISPANTNDYWDKIKK
ncbi:MAG: DUF4835 family protein [Flavobacteriales bacterium]|nr:DUF4835 family protein [Flavobacteriales bacterium]